MNNTWEEMNFEDCLQNVTYTKKIQKSEFLEVGAYPIISQEKEKTNGYWDNPADLFRIKTPIVIFGDHTQVIKYIDFDFVLGADGVKILQPITKLNPRFFYYLVSNIQLEKLGYARHYRLLKEKTIAFPPLPEQQRIVTILDEAFSSIAKAKENTEKNLQNARDLLNSSLFSEFAIRNDDWERLTLYELLERGWIKGHLDGNHGSDYPKKEEFIDSGVAYISANCIKGDSVDMTEAKYLSPERAALIKKGVAHNQDVLFAHNATVGPVAVLYTDMEKIILGTSLTYYRCNFDKILPEYLAHYMRSPGFISQYSQTMRQSTRNQIPITKQREFFHVIPPISIQKAIAKKLDALSTETNKLEAIYINKLVDLEELKKSILQKAFNGEL